jgi:hypothetical protein
MKKKFSRMSAVQVFVYCRNKGMSLTGSERIGLTYSCNSFELKEHLNYLLYTK